MIAALAARCEVVLAEVTELVLIAQQLPIAPGARTRAPPGGRVVRGANGEGDAQLLQVGRRALTRAWTSASCSGEQMILMLIVGATVMARGGWRRSPRA